MFQVEDAFGAEASQDHEVEVEGKEVPRSPLVNESRVEVRRPPPHIDTMTLPIPPPLVESTSPVGGRIQKAAQNWTILGADNWLIETVTKGYKIRFEARPPMTSPKTPAPLPHTQEKRQAVLQLIDKLLLKNIIDSNIKLRMYLKKLIDFKVKF